ncbi:NUDIX domain-containing protein [Ruminococcus flavefaciens]|uniref:8-oxo-dGTP pyrophosphatase MutT (NUDIX family) n=1 Tax=Ruminococcus flavefaciens TaxID=1265 RepID=A0A315YS31_RUMFL|nr:NUDIX domain-containing protein [Ruminococcus flavefaciens]PWJ15197.1 8-oxo-dGTP pyrophosphatase MutT (NUDIX family) [Ruminococcus flavefaciens]SSA40243.1 8-oxo-dGTP pyrophosphatase MutT, NUDIX family [Ruminococcus flavefaciens]
MRRLFIMDQKDYDNNWKRYKRPSVRGIIIKNNKVAMVYSRKFDYYKFPGGGIENNEDHITTLKRELSEETGLSVSGTSVTEYGSVLRIQKSRFEENVIFEQENFYYLCDVLSDTYQQTLDEYEADEGFVLEYVSPEYAISVNRTHDHFDYDEYLIERESKVLESLVKDGLL